MELQTITLDSMKERKSTDNALISRHEFFSYGSILNVDKKDFSHDKNIQNQIGRASCRERV